LKKRVKRKEQKEAVRVEKHTSPEFDNDVFKSLLIDKRPIKESGSLSEAKTNAYNYNQAEAQGTPINYDFQSNGKNLANPSETKIVLNTFSGKGESCGHSFQQQSKVKEFRADDYTNSNPI